MTFDAELCTQGTYVQPQKTFAVYVFCDSSLGVNIGIILNDFDADFDSTRWGPVNRFWQNAEWSMDVSSFSWGPIGNTLFVATSSVYGSGGVYRLDLRRRAHNAVFQIDDLDEVLVEREGRAIGAEAYEARIAAVGNNESTITLEIRLLGDGKTTTVGRKVLNLDDDD